MIAVALAFLLIASDSPPLGLPEASRPEAVEADDETSEGDADDDVAEDDEADDDEAEAGASAPRLPPVDDCGSDPEFTAFRDELQRAVIAHDTAALLALVDEDVDVGGGSGREAFIRAWRLDMPGESRLWSELGKALSLGCSREDDEEYWAPSLYLQLDEREEADFDALALQGGELHAAPDPASEVAARLDWELASVPSDDGTADWQRVRLADGRTGFVRRADLRRVTDYRAGFERLDDGWVLSGFVAGDEGR